MAVARRRHGRDRRLGIACGRPIAIHPLEPVALRIVGKHVAVVVDQELDRRAAGGLMAVEQNGRAARARRRPEAPAPVACHQAAAMTRRQHAPIRRRRR